jgi:hypothetical protein
MGYMHINNLYKDQRILEFRECYALEKVHGTSAHVALGEAGLKYFSGGENYEKFVAIFDEMELLSKMTAVGHPNLTIFGEAYGGKQQGMKDTYGNTLCFIAFDVKIGDNWLDVPVAEKIVKTVGLEFVPYCRISTDVTAVDAERDKPSEVAIRRGMGNDKRREGVVLRPPFEVIVNSGERVMSKHKNDEFRETATPRDIRDPGKREKLFKADQIAQEWVTPMRLTHVLDKLPHDTGMEHMRIIIEAMTIDIEREAAGEVEMSNDARRAIASRTARMFKDRMKASLGAANA